MGATSVLKIDIITDAARARSGLNDVDRSASKTADKVQGHFRRMAAGAAKAFAGLAVVDFLKDSVGAYQEAEAGQAKFLDAMGRVPGITSSATEAIQSQAEALALKTKFDDDATKSGQAVLAGFGLTAKQILKTTPLLQDYAERTGKDLPTAARDLGKAFSGSTGPLKKIGIDIKATGDKSKDFAAVTTALQGKIGGLAQTAGGTAAGKMAILKNQFGEVQEAVGAALVPILTKLGSILLSVVGFIQRNSAVIIPLVGVIGTVVAIIKAWTIVQGILNAVIAANPIVLIIAALAALAVGLVLAWKRSQTFRNILKAAFAPIIIQFRLFMTVAKLLFSVAKTVFNGVWNIAKSAFGGVRTAIGFVGTAIKNAYNSVKSFGGNLIDFIKGIPGKIVNLGKAMLDAGKHLIGKLFDGFKNAAGAVGNFAKDLAKAVINKVIDGLNAIIPHKLHIHIPIPALPDVDINIPLIPEIPHIGAAGSSDWLGMQKVPTFTDNSQTIIQLDGEQINARVEKRVSYELGRAGTRARAGVRY